MRQVPLLKKLTTRTDTWPTIDDPVDVSKRVRHGWRNTCSGGWKAGLLTLRPTQSLPLPLPNMYMHMYVHVHVRTYNMTCTCCMYHVRTRNDRVGTTVDGEQERGVVSSTNQRRRRHAPCHGKHAS